MIRVQIPIRPATDPTNIPGLVYVPRHRATVVSKDAREAEIRAMNYGEDRDKPGEHLAEMDGAE